MRIECPNCKASGTINEHEIPEDGRMLVCPRCKENFRIARPRRKAASPFASNTCPSCGYSTFCEEVFDECPHCGADVKDIMQRKRAEDLRRGEQDMLNRFSRSHAPADVVPMPAAAGQPASSPKAEKRPISLAHFANGFDPVAAVGWGGVAGGLVVLALGGWGLITYLGTDIQGQLSAQSIEPVSAWQVFWGYGFLPWVEAIFGLILLVASFGFLQRTEWGMKGLRNAVSAALILAPAYEVGSFVNWIVKSIAPPWWAYLVEGLSTLLVTALWMLPLFFLLRYLQGKALQRSYALPP